MNPPPDHADPSPPAGLHRWPELAGLAIAAVAVFVATVTALVQWQQTRTALARTAVEGRASACLSMAAIYASQSWAYSPVVQGGAEDNAPLYTARAADIGPNELLADFSGKAMAVSRALRLCLNRNDSPASLAECVRSDVDLLPDYWVDDDADQKPDQVIC